jgi:glycine betaine/proline transport system ATP-binding protein
MSSLGSLFVTRKQSSLDAPGSSLGDRVSENAPENKGLPGGIPSDGSAVIECRSVWKLFGDKEISSATKARILAGEISREDALHRYRCVISVQDVSFSVTRGEIFCVMGLSGSGKSTLVRHINRLIEPTSGDVFIDGKSVRNLSTTELRKMRAQRIGMVFQSSALLPHRTVASNIGLSLELRNVDPRLRSRTVARVLQTVGLTGWGERNLTDLSGGMQQRVGLARALAADPEILLMDEPFSALDPLIRRQLQDEFKTLSRSMGKTTIFITHDLEEAVRIADRIAIMKDGKLVQVGTPEEIVMQPSDAFVAEFVKGISRRQLITAKRLMVTADDFIAATGLSRQNLDSFPSAQPESSLQVLIEAAACHEAPIAIRSGGKVMGVVTTQALLAALREEHTQ